MIKKNKDSKPLFHPTFGSRPAQIVGREAILSEFRQSLDEPIGSRERCRFYIGQRGMGKTALLLEMADIAIDNDFVVARVTAYEGMNDDIIETLQRNGTAYVKTPKKTVKGASAGALGFSVGLTFSEEAKEQYGFRTKLTMLCEALEKAGKGVLILVDEAHTSPEMRELAVTYQHLVGEDKNIAIVMAGLPQAVSGVLNDDVLTFLNRAVKTHLPFIRTSEIALYYRDAFHKSALSLSDSLIEKAAEASDGFPYLMQLIGYYLLRNAQIAKGSEEDWLNLAIRDAGKDMDENVFVPILHPLSDNDLQFLRAMAIDDAVSKVSDIGKRWKKKNSYIQPYRARLMEAGIVESPRTGELVFSIPYLRDYLRNN